MAFVTILIGVNSILLLIDEFLVYVPSNPDINLEDA